MILWVLLFSECLTNIIEKGENRDTYYNHLIGQRWFLYGNQKGWQISKTRQFFKNPKKKKLLSYEDLWEKTLVLHRIYKDGLDYVFVMTEEGKSDTIYYKQFGFIMNNSWVIEGYYEKAKNDYLNKEFILLKDKYKFIFDEADWLLDMKTGEPNLQIPEGTLWRCVDISVTDKNENSSRSNVILIFENDKFGKYYIYLDRNSNRESVNYERSRITLDIFTSKDSYTKLLQRKKDEEIAQKERNERIIQLYGAEDGNMILNGQVKLGFTEDMCISAWGYPTDKNVTIGNYGKHEQWVYDDNRYLYFEDGILTDIQYNISQ